jgi:hypothetical protein
LDSKKIIKDSLLAISFGFLESIKRKEVLLEINESKIKNISGKKTLGKTLVYPQVFKQSLI